MIYTVTLNPSLDYIVDVENFQLGMTNRTCAEQIRPGGKGVNVSLMLQNLGVESIALGFVAGFTGEEICRRLAGCGLCTGFLRMAKGDSRINLKLRSVEGTEVNGRGPVLEPCHLKRLEEQLAGLAPGDVLCLAGRRRCPRGGRRGGRCGRAAAGRARSPPVPDQAEPA